VYAKCQGRIAKTSVAPDRPKPTRLGPTPFPNLAIPDSALYSVHTLGLLAGCEKRWRLTGSRTPEIAIDSDDMFWNTYQGRIRAERSKAGGSARCWQAELSGSALQVLLGIVDQVSFCRFHFGEDSLTVA
jgi:hypothetical protein